MGSCIVKSASPPADAQVVMSNSANNDLSMPRKEVKEGGVSRSQLILDRTGRIQDLYNMDKKKLGEGTYGAVYRGTHKTTGRVRAIKTIPKTQMRNVERFKKEIAIMKIMDHPSIIKLFETLEDSRFIYLAMELCTGGELFDKIIAAGHFTEADAAVVMQQILRAVFYMHENNICHRDLKPENFLFQTKESIAKNVLKLIDFGLSCHCMPGDTMTTKAGTPYYVAPQVLQGKYDATCDVWSCGVIMYILLCGYPPFYGHSDGEVLSKVRLGHVAFDVRDWKHVSQGAKELIRAMLKVNPKDRYTAEEALNHAWTKQKAPCISHLPLQKNLVENLRAFRSQNRFAKAVLHIIAGQLSEGQIRGLRETFLKLDGNGDGLLTLKELREGLQLGGVKELPSDLQEIMDSVDSDGSGVIDYTEFLAATLERRLYLQEDVCWCAFKVFDLNSDGKISLDELRLVLDSNSVESAMGAQAVQEMLKEVDRNGDGSIDFDEFMAMMRGTQAAEPAPPKGHRGKPA